MKVFVQLINVFELYGCNCSVMTGNIINKNQFRKKLKMQVL